MRLIILAALLLVPGAVYAQAPAAGSHGGGAVGPSVAKPAAPTGATPPGTPAAGPTRNHAGQAVIGTTAVPGSTDRQEVGVK